MISKLEMDHDDEKGGREGKMIIRYSFSSYLTLMAWFYSNHHTIF